MRRSVLALALGAALTVTSCAQLGPAAQRPDTTSPYVGQLDSPVRGLTAQEVDDLLAGRGAGYARSAELNGYPGPRHMLDMGDKLSLQPEQRAKLTATFETMEARAKALGAQIVERERALSAAFTGGTLTPEALRQQTAELGQLYADLRATHLTAHLAIFPVLTPEQVAGYNVLRGYTGNDPMAPGMSHDHHG
jgi:Spy/CpxP family protein refolding chaperone